MPRTVKSKKARTATRTKARTRTTAKAKAKGQVFLIVRSGRNVVFIAARALRVPAKYVGDVLKYKPKRGDGVTKSNFAFVVRSVPGLQEIFGEYDEIWPIP
jgi:hypothetical protein